MPVMDWYEEAERIYEIVRSGDHLLMHFKFDLCHFRNMQEKVPNSNREEDERLMTTIRRSTLDVFWSR